MGWADRIDLDGGLLGEPDSLVGAHGGQGGFGGGLMIRVGVSPGLRSLWLGLLHKGRKTRRGATGHLSSDRRPVLGLVGHVHGLGRANDDVGDVDFDGLGDCIKNRLGDIVRVTEELLHVRSESV